jgi:CRP/FNR family transcriptional regulator
VSRVLSRFQDDALLRVERRDVELLQPTQLEELARSVLRE